MLSVVLPQCSKVDWQDCWEWIERTVDPRKPAALAVAAGFACFSSIAPAFAQGFDLEAPVSRETGSRGSPGALPVFPSGGPEFRNEEGIDELPVGQDAVVIQGVNTAGLVRAGGQNSLRGKVLGPASAWFSEFRANSTKAIKSVSSRSYIDLEALADRFGDASVQAHQSDMAEAEILCLNNQGNCYYYMNRPQAARRCYQQALEILEESPSANRGLVRHLASNFAEATRLMHRDVKRFDGLNDDRIVMAEVRALLKPFKSVLSVDSHVSDELGNDAEISAPPKRTIRWILDVSDIQNTSAVKPKPTPESEAWGLPQ